MPLSPFTTPIVQTPAASIRSIAYGLDNAKTPISRRKWSDDEIRQLLTLIQKKKTVPEIATILNRPISSINVKRLALAVDYYISENRPIPDIQKFTGLSVDEINKAIKKHQEKQKPVEGQEAKAEPSVQVTKDPEPEDKEPTKKEMMNVLLALQMKLKILVPDEPEPTMKDLMKVVKDLEKRMDTLIHNIQ